MIELLKERGDGLLSPLQELRSWPLWRSRAFHDLPENYPVVKIREIKICIVHIIGIWGMIQRIVKILKTILKN